MTYYAWAPAGSQQPRGEPNPRTGNRSYQGKLSVFTTMTERDHFVAASSGRVQVITAADARRMWGGLTDTEFKRAVAHAKAWEV